MKKQLFLISLLPMIGLSFILTVSNVNAQASDWLWAKSMGGNKYDNAVAVGTDVKGNAYVAGYYGSDTIYFGSSFLTNPGGDNVFLAKYNTGGNLLWAKKPNGTGGYNKATCLAVDASGNSFMAGNFTSETISFGSDTLINASGEGTESLFLVKYDSSGNALWAVTEGVSAGGASVMFDVSATSVAVDNKDNTYVTGTFLSHTLVLGTTTLVNDDSTHNTTDVFIVKYNSIGQVQWAKSANGTANDYSASIAVNVPLNTICMAGYFQSPTITFGSTTLTNAGTENLFLAKYDTLGNLTWAKSVGCNMDDVGNGVALDASGSIYLTGDFNSPTIVFDTTTLTNVGDFNIFLAKFNSSGTVLWAKGAGGNMVDVSNTVAVDASGNPYIAGAFQGINIQFGSSIFVNTDPGNYDVFLAKYDNNGNVLCAARAAGTYDDVASSIAVDGSGNSYIVGYFYSPSLLFGSTTLTNADNVANNTSDGFLAKLSANTGINELSEISNISVFPNPANDIITIENTAFTKDETISIYDIQGQLLLQQTMLQAKTNIDISAFSKGIYFVKVKTANGMDVKKIVKE